MMIDDYKKAVISDYHKKKDNDKLSSNLSRPTCKRLKEECLAALRSRTLKKDEKIIRDFFNDGNDSNDYYNCIRKFERDKFKPLDNFMSGETNVRDEKNIEILAWLIGFEPRPYDPRIDYSTIDEDVVIEENKDTKEEQKPGKPDEKTPKTPSTDTRKKLPLTKYGIDLIVLLITIIGGVGLSMRNANIEKNTTAYICTSNIAKKYHLSTKCHGLNNCKSNIVSTTIASAKERGRTLCEIEH